MYGEYHLLAWGLEKDLTYYSFFSLLEQIKASILVPSCFKSVFPPKKMNNHSARVVNKLLIFVKVILIFPFVQWVSLKEDISLQAEKLQAIFHTIDYSEITKSIYVNSSLAQFFFPSRSIAESLVSDDMSIFSSM